MTRTRPRGPSLPPHQKVALTYREVQLCGLCSERKLRELVSSGRVKRSVLRTDRCIRFLREQLIEELRNMQN